MAENISQRSDLVRVDDTLEISHQSASGAEIENLSEDVVPRASQQMCLTSFSLFLDSTGGNPRSKLHRSDQLLSYSGCRLVQRRQLCLALPVVSVSGNAHIRMSLNRATGNWENKVDEGTCPQKSHRHL